MFKGRHFDRLVILLCVRWYLVYNLSLRNPEEMMAERGVVVDHATIHRRIIYYARSCWSSLTSASAKSLAGGIVTGRRHFDETYIKVRRPWMYLYRAIDSHGDTVEFWFSECRNLTATKRFPHKASSGMAALIGSSLMAARRTVKQSLSCDTESRLQDRVRGRLKPIRIRQSAYLNNHIEQDHRAVKRPVRPMLGFKSASSARVIMGGVEMIPMMRKQQATCVPAISYPSPSYSTDWLRNACGRNSFFLSASRIRDRALILRGRQARNPPGRRASAKPIFEQSLRGLAPTHRKAGTPHETVQIGPARATVPCHCHS